MREMTITFVSSWGEKYNICVAKVDKSISGDGASSGGCCEAKRIENNWFVSTDLKECSILRTCCVLSDHAGYILLKGSSDSRTEEIIGIRILGMCVNFYPRLASSPKFPNPMVWPIVFSGSGPVAKEAQFSKVISQPLYFREKSARKWTG